MGLSGILLSSLLHAMEPVGSRLTVGGLSFKVTQLDIYDQPLHSSLQSTDTIPSNAFTDNPPALVQPCHRFYNVDTTEGLKPWKPSFENGVTAPHYACLLL